jgi:hypothetical protein
MAETKCGFDSVSGGASGADLLVSYGPAIFVNIGFDPAFTSETPFEPVPGITGISALVDTGASESCIDSLLAAQLNLPVVDKRSVSGVHGAQPVNMHLAQVHIPSLGLTLWGAFAGVHLATAGQIHRALVGRTFLRHCKMNYDGKTGTVIISSV